MKIRAAYVAAGMATAISCVSIVTPAEAALQDRGGGMIYDDGLNVTWTQNARLFAAQLATNPNLVNDIMAVTPTINDPFWGPHAIGADDFQTVNDSNGHVGMMTWFGAKAWVNWLNSKSYGGHTDWRLPNVEAVNGSAFVYGPASGGLGFDGTVDLGYSIKSKSAELAYLYYVSLGNNPGFDSNGVAVDPGPLQPGPFANLARDTFWYGTDYALDPSNIAAAWVFGFGDGIQAFADKPNKSDVWPVHPGDSSGSATPTPTIPVATATPTPAATAVPTPTTAATPTPEPTAAVTPTPQPTDAVTPTPVVSTTPAPTGTQTPTDAPTSIPTSQPTSIPTAVPTAVPTNQPTAVPSTAPTSVPTSQPTSVPTPVPTSQPTPVPSQTPTPTPIIIGGGDVTDYNFHGDAYCKLKGNRRHRWATFLARVNNDGKISRPGAELMINVQQDGETFNDLYVSPRSQVVYARPGRGKWVKAIWEIEGEGDITFNASLIDGNANDGSDMASCTISASDLSSKHQHGGGKH
jgi:hypothetical protein